ncbi:hypothetical protein VNO78_06595 [Psophocarpus tetragonolobus]|uniref:Germin-like protein n=1 Tax=Psophocarpus tetragonolobus TaxID=3891 RepID=A0AAN9T1S5_PSOTE
MGGFHGVLEDAGAVVTDEGGKGHKGVIEDVALLNLRVVKEDGEGDALRNEALFAMRLHGVVVNEGSELMDMTLTFFILAILSFSFTSYASNVNDFCVADLKAPYTPSGYPCLPPNKLTVDNFVFNLQPPNNSNPIIKAGINRAFVNEFPALNGLGISIAHVVIDKDGYFPMHTHNDATELIIMLDGQLVAGFITGTNAYVKTLKAGDLMAIPPGQLHFVANSGPGKVSCYAAFSSSNPNVFSFNSIFNNDVPYDILVKTTFLDVPEVKKLKARFGGRG